MIFVVTVSQTYYPDAGSGDWRSVHTDACEAQRAYDEIPCGSYEYKTLVRIDPAAGTFADVECSA